MARLRHSSRLAVRELGLLDDKCVEDCTVAEAHALIEIGASGHLTSADLAGRLHQDPSTVSRTVARLQRDGLVASAQSRIDRREKPLHLTQAGRETLNRINRGADRQVRSALDLLKPQEREMVVRGMELYAVALDRSRRRGECEIRLIDEADNPTIAKIIHDVMTEFGAVGEGYSILDSEIADMYDSYRPPRAAYYVVQTSEGVVGGGGFGPLRGGPADTCELRKMYLLPEARGLGLGQELLNLCLDEARSVGYKRCYLETISEMNRAQELYEKNGFTKIKEPIGDTGHFSCNSFFTRDLVDA